METLLDEPTMRPNPPPNFEAKVDQIESVYRRIITSKA
jgi:hypothetical protein